MDVEHGRDASAISGRDASLIQLHVLHDAAVEGREETEQMRRVVDGPLVPLDEVLVGSAPSHIQPGGRFAHGLNTRKRLYYLDDVQFAESGRDGFQVLGYQGLYAHLYALHVVYLVGRNGYFLQCLHLVFQFDVQCSVSVHHQSPVGIDDTYAGHFNVHLALGYIQHIMPVAIAYGCTPCRCFHNQVDSRYRFSGLETGYRTCQLHHLSVGCCSRFAHRINLVSRSGFLLAGKQQFQATVCSGSFFLGKERRNCHQVLVL